jgi:hypothetical protein
LSVTVSLEISFMRRFFRFAGVITMLVAIPVTAKAQQPALVQVGVLECRGGASIGFIVGSVTNLGCVLRVDGRPEDRYIATIRKIGVDLGITQESALAWGVFAPVKVLGPGDLTGNYAGARQCPCRRLEQFDCAAAAQLAGAGRRERRRRS